MNASFKRRRLRVGVLTLVLAALFLLVAMRLLVLVMFDGGRLNSMAKVEHTEQIALAAVRGPIVDRRGEPLALSAETRSIYARPHRLLAASSAAQLARLAEMLGLTGSQLKARLARRAPFVWLGRQLPRQQADKIEALGLDGVGVVEEFKRFYPESNLAAGVVGMAGVDGQGLSGLESEYDRMIRGEPAALNVERDALGHPILDTPLALRSAEAGARLELAIDSEIQALVERQLIAQVKSSAARRATAIVLDPFTGEVLAMATINADPKNARDRLHDGAVQDAFEPGSTLKGILGAIALEERAFSTSERVFCENGQMEIGRRLIHDDGPHRWLDLGGILEVSSNIGAAKIAMALGANRYYKGLQAFGFGRRTGIDLPGETRGLLRAPATWHEIDLAEHGFGQGIAVTPIQLAVAYAAIANGGVTMRPFLVRAVYDAEGRELLRHTPQVLGRAVSPAVAHTMNLLLRKVVSADDGTGRRAQVDDYLVAGKTGTAQMVDPETGTYYRDRRVASFVGFVPADDPRLVVLVVLEDVNRGEVGGLAAAPVFSAIAGGALGTLNVASERSEYAVASLIPAIASPAHASDREVSRPPMAARAPVASKGRAPDFSALSLRAALRLAHRARVAVEIDGSGYVVKQRPAPGAALDGAPVKLRFRALALEKSSAKANRSTSGAAPNHRDSRSSG